MNALIAACATLMSFGWMLVLMGHALTAHGLPL